MRGGEKQRCMLEHLNLHDRCCQNLEFQKKKFYYNFTYVLFHLYKRGVYANSSNGIKTEHTKLNVIHF